MVEDDAINSEAEPANGPVLVTLENAWTRSERPSTAIVDVIASATGRDPMDLSPLHQHVDPDALDALLTGERGAPEERVDVSFRVDGVVVVASSDGKLDVRTPEN